MRLSSSPFIKIVNSPLTRAEITLSSLELIFFNVNILLSMTFFFQPMSIQNKESIKTKNAIKKILYNIC